MPDTKRAMWLIDASYLYNAQRSVARDYAFDYRKLRSKIEEHTPIWRAYYLNSTNNPPSAAEIKFNRWLQLGQPTGPQFVTQFYTICRKRAYSAYCLQCRDKVNLSCPHDGRHYIVNFQQKGVDVGLATLALIHRDKYDTLILSSGDADLLDAVEYLSEQGKRIELAVFHRGVSSELQCRADDILWIDDFAADLARGGIEEPQAEENDELDQETIADDDHGEPNTPGSAPNP